MRLVVGVPEPHVTKDVLEPAAEAVTRLDQQQIEQGEVPTFHDALRAGKVQWRPEPPGEERFDHASTVMNRGWGDCDDLAPWRAASARATGEDPGAKAIMLRRSPTLWHCVVQMSDGRIEDPSKEAGMHRRQARENAPATPIMQPAAVVGGVKRPSVAVRPVSRRGRIVGWQGRVDLPMSATEAALVQLHYAPVASQAIIGAANEISILADAACTLVDPETLAPVDAIQGLLSGCGYGEVSAVCGDQAVERAIAFLDTAERVCGPLHARPRRIYSVGRPGTVGSLWDDITDAASSAVDAAGGVVDAVSSAIDSASHVLTPVLDAAKEVLSAAQGVISLIPGIGTGISAAISAGLAALEGGSPLEIAIKTAYGALPIPPGIRDVTDTVLDAVLALVKSGSVENAVLTAARDRVPDGFPRDVFDTLVHLFVTATTGKPTVAVATPKDGTNPGDPVQVAQVPVLHITTATGQKVIQAAAQRTAQTAQRQAGFKLAGKVLVPRTSMTAPGSSLLRAVAPTVTPTTIITTSAPPSSFVQPSFMQGLPPNAQFVAPAGVTLG